MEFYFLIVSCSLGSYSKADSTPRTRVYYGPTRPSSTLTAVQASGQQHRPVRRRQEGLPRPNTFFFKLLVVAEDPQERRCPTLYSESWSGGERQVRGEGLREGRVQAGQRRPEVGGDQTPALTTAVLPV
jgi:hypothetical protein